MGREFLHVFDEWADHYDETVTGNDREYEEVFRNYDEILQEVADLTSGNVLEFGPGTGNLTVKLLEKGLRVLAIEPSSSMRNVAESKIKSKHVRFVDGDFFQYPTNETIDTIVSTFAFHHLSDEEKAAAVKQYGNLLKVDGKIVFADTMYVNEIAHKEAIQEAERKGFLRLADDLRTEYYPTIPYIDRIFKENGFSISFKRCNQFVWILQAVKL